jgi:hypothetical protein
MKTLTCLNLITRTIGGFIQATEKQAPEAFKVIDQSMVDTYLNKITPVTGVLER